MQIVILLILMAVTAAALANGFVSILFITGICIYLLATSKDADKSMDFFYALCFFGGILAVMAQAVTS